MQPQQRQAEARLDALAGKIAAMEEARNTMRELDAFIKQIEEEVKEAMGLAEKATVFGVPYFTYQPKAAYAWRKFQDDHPHIARNYVRVVPKEELDKEKLLAEQGDVLANYQTREFRWISKKPGA